MGILKRISKEITKAQKIVTAQQKASDKRVTARQAIQIKRARVDLKIAQAERELQELRLSVHREKTAAKNARKAAGQFTVPERVARIIGKGGAAGVGFYRGLAKSRR